MSKTSYRGGNLLTVPTGDCCLQLITIIFATGGLAWLQIGWAINADDDPRRLLSRQELEQQVLIVSEKKRTSATALDQRTADAQRLARELEQARSHRPDTTATKAELQRGIQRLEQLRQERESLQRLLQELTQRLARLEQQQRDLEKQRSDLAQKERELDKIRRQVQQDQQRLEQVKRQLAEVDKQVQEQETANTQLREKIAVEQRKAQAAPSVSVEAQPRFLGDSKLKAELFMLHEGTVTPIQEPHYKFLKREDGSTLATRVSAGETADRALADGSAFLKALAAIDPTKQYAALLVDAASFETFRTVRPVCGNAGSSPAGSQTSTPRSPSSPRAAGERTSARCRSTGRAGTEYVRLSSLTGSAWKG